MADLKEEIFRGLPASPGIIIGVTKSLTKNNEPLISEAVEDPEAEARAFRIAIDRVKNALERTASRVLQRYGKDFARIFEAQAMIAGDEVWNENIQRRILGEKICAEYIYDDEARKVTRKLEESQDSYLKERIQDIHAVTLRLVRYMRGEKQTSLRGIKVPTVVMAHYLSPADILAISFRKNVGFVTGVGGPTSHVTLMAKSLGIPAVIGVGEVTEKIPSGAKVIIDGYKGLFILNPEPQTIARYHEAKKSETILLKEFSALKTKPGVTADGVEVAIMANIELPGEVSKVLAAGAQGIGLYRTEYLFLTRTDFPTFDEQYRAYAEILRRMGNRPVIIRTFDLGGDKFPGMAGNFFEANPFLGWRAIRFCLDRPDIFKIQLKALLKASVSGNLSILIPMISNYEELMTTKRILEECKDELRQAKVKFAEKVPLGIMLEVPSAAMIAEHLAGEVDFFSIGTNDLIQYTVAVDRDHEMLTRLYQSFHPSVLALIKMSAEAARRHRIPISVCGEMASDPLAAVLLVGLGINQLSAGFRSAGILKRIVRSITYEGAQKIAKKALTMKTHGEIENYLLREISRVFPETVPVIDFSRRKPNG